ncbi:putative tight adherance operon protein [Yersinia mollaretii]|uniref:A24 family peptidase n=1 Tax=Yersinia mollaretii TaxID=33060 RepID=UPI0005E4FD3D|nr:prepilin peptidase [Yersinia mollaretii]CNK45081.1 putative tight adherance operon protein [Yersinia mollaretii]
MDILTLSLMALLILQLLLVCYSDIRHRIISNKLIVTIAINTLVLGFAKHNTVSIVIPLCTLLAGYTVFYFNLIGGGDVKLITVLLLTLTAGQSLDFILYTAIMGGIVMVIGMLINRADIQQRGVPYAVAISIGFLLALFT